MALSFPPVISSDTTALTSATKDVAQLLYGQAIASPQKEALVYGNVRLTYEQLASRSKAIANQLIKLGMGKSDKIGLLFPNQPEYVASFFAVATIGGTVVPINPLLKSEEIAHILSDSGAKALITYDNTIDEAIAALPKAPTIKHVVVFRSSTSPLPLTTSAIIVELTCNSSFDNSIVLASDIDPATDLAVLVYTSGTTGKPKGAMLTHHNIQFAIGSVLNTFNLGDTDRFMAVLPLCHIYGLTIVMLGTISRGGTVVILEKFEAASALELIERERVTLLPAVPAMYQFMLMELEKTRFDLSSVRMCLSGAAALPIELISQIESAFGAPLVEGYGMTETSCIASVNPLHGKRKAGSVGPSIDNVVVAIMNEAGELLPNGTAHIGEIVIQGPNIMAGYFNKPEATEEVFLNGWFLTGDLGYKDEDGYLYIVGRKKELIIRGGQNIYPREIEEVIARMPQVAEVAVIGVPDKYMGERVKAVVVLKDGASTSEEEVKEYCLKRLAEYKVPRLVEFRSELPRNSTGKILKRMLT